MAPTFDEDDSRDRLRSLWDAGQDLTDAAASRSELEVALEAAQREYEAALATRSALLAAYAAAQAAYTAAHTRAVAVGWSSPELSEAGLPTPPARHSGAPGRERRHGATALGAPEAPVASITQIPTPARVPTTDPRPATDEAAAPSPGRADQRSSWDAEQTAFLVTSRSKDNPVWYESMRRSWISPSTDDATALDGPGRQSPTDPADE